MTLCVISFLVLSFFSFFFSFFLFFFLIDHYSKYFFFDYLLARCPFDYLLLFLFDTRKAESAS